MPKFLCVKGILFFSFWQSLLISILVAARAISRLGPYTDSEHISVGLTDTLICLEMPLFAVAHMYAFATRDFVDPRMSFVARMPVFYAARDAFGFKDVVEDLKATLHGERMDYREFEPSEGFIHQGAGRDRRIRAGLRYSQGGKKKYWLPQLARDTRPAGGVERTVNRAIQQVTGEEQDEDVYAPLLANQAQDVVHTAPDLRLPTAQAELGLFDSVALQDDGFGLPFDLDDADEALFEHSKKYVFGDYHYPCVDVSSEAARKTMWDEEERILRDERSAYFSPMLGPGRVLGNARQNYGALGNFQRGAVRERRDSDGSDGSRGKGKTKVARREIVIDKEHDRLPEVGEVRLRWTSSKDHMASQSSHVRTSASPIAKTQSSESSGSSPAGRQPPPSPRKETEGPVLPPDAVDLIVEDLDAAEVEQSYERRKGEPAVRGTTSHKVYRRGYVVENGQERREVQVEVAPSSRGQQPVFDVGDDVEDVMEEEAEALEDAMVARAVTPPSYARQVYSPELLDDENPWA